MTRPRAMVEFLIAMVVYPLFGIYRFFRDWIGGVIFEFKILIERLES